MDLGVYEREEFLGQCLSKADGKFYVQCFSLPFGVWLAQIIDKKQIKYIKYQ